jgi:hypothetical protein
MSSSRARALSLARSLARGERGGLLRIDRDVCAGMILVA